MIGYEPARWSEFALAHLGASAALLGLVFVALSINLRDVVGSQPLVNRAAEAVVVLASVLVTATVVLIPGQDRGVLSAEVLAVAVVTSFAVWRLEGGSRAMGRKGDERGPSPSQVAFRRAMCLGAQLLLVVAAIALAVEAGGGLYWWPAAVVAAYVGALGNAWVLLIEILR
ncbi:MAG TPA: hypothetical protein VM121_06470 [Acidimicrobiales bacterium]|nr:hypothetical protein [Acidimicrobiales bacterium]